MLAAVQCDSRAFSGLSALTLRIPWQTGHRFHAKAATDSTAIWPLIPRQSGHPFHGKAATDSTANWPPFWGRPEGPELVRISVNVVVSFFEDHLKVQKGLRPSSIRSYRDVLKLFLNQIASRHHCPVTRLALADLNSNEVLAFLKSLESERGNLIRTRNQRLAALRTFFRYLASRAPEALAEAERVEAIPVKRCAPPQTYFLERDEVEQLFTKIRASSSAGLRDRGILTLMYNTGARVQEIADLRVQDVDLDGPYRVRLHGKGDKWRVCPIWPETASLLKQLDTICSGDSNAPLFRSRLHRPLTRFGLYKLVKRHAGYLTLLSACINPRRPETRARPAPKPISK